MTPAEALMLLSKRQSTPSMRDAAIQAISKELARLSDIDRTITEIDAWFKEAEKHGCKIEIDTYTPRVTIQWMRYGFRSVTSAPDLIGALHAMARSLRTDRGMPEILQTHNDPKDK